MGFLGRDPAVGGYVVEDDNIDCHKCDALYFFGLSNLALHWNFFINLFLIFIALISLTILLICYFHFSSYFNNFDDFCHFYS